MPDELSAEVVLRPAHEPGAAAPATAATIHQHLPDPVSAERVRSWFADRGFASGPVFAISFSITGPAERFASAFDMDEDTVTQMASQGGELPLDALPSAARGTVQAVAFGAPPDFGPGAP